ncbi:hypothetical protein [Halorubrum luteum]
MHEQDQVATFLDRHEMETTLAYHVLDLQSEVGEVAKEVTTSTSQTRSTQRSRSTSRGSRPKATPAPGSRGLPAVPESRRTPRGPV